MLTATTRNLALALTALACAQIGAATIHVPKGHATIQAAVDAAAAGDTVLVAAGTYKERVALKPGVTLRSAGDDAKGKLGLKRAEATVIDGSAAQGDAAKAAGVAMAEGAALDGFTITGVGTYDDKRWNKHHAEHGEHQEHEHIGTFGTTGVAVDGVSCVIRHNIVHHIGDTGIAIRGAKGRVVAPVVEHNVAYRNMGGGIGIMRGARGVVRGNVCFENFYAGIGHDNSSPLVVDNTCYGNVRAGIGVSEGACPTVMRNRCYQNRRAGIGIRTGADTRPLVEDNDCYENEMAGIGAKEKAQPVIRGNRCYRNKLAGIGAQLHATPTIVGNTCYENGMAGIGMRGGVQAVIMDNVSRDNKRAGIGLDGGPGGRARVAGNKLTGNAMVAIGIHGGWTVELAGNEMSREGGMPPLVMVFKGATVTATGNALRGSGVAGFRVAGTLICENNRFDGVKTRKVGPPHFAVWALEGARVVMVNNDVSNFRHGLFADKAEVSAHDNRVEQYHQQPIVVRNPAPAQR